LISSPGQKGIAKKEKGVLLGGTKCGRLFINKGERGREKAGIGLDEGP